jgi:hypothetical protein
MSVVIVSAETGKTAAAKPEASDVRVNCRRFKASVLIFW